MGDQWAFGCEFGLEQETCGEYTPDPKARGWGRYSGCASCQFRVPANEATQAAELAWETRHILKD